MAESEFADHQTSLDRRGQLLRSANVQQRQVLPCEARVGAVLVHGRGADRERAVQLRDRLGYATNRRLVAAGHGVHNRARERHAGRHRKPISQRLTEAHRLGAEQRRVLGRDQRNHFAHANTVTSPESPSTRTRVPSAMRLGGLTGSHHTRYPVLARHDRRMREQPAAVGDDRPEQRQEDVEGLARGLGHQHVALDDAVEFGRARDATGRTLVDAAAGREPAQHVLLVFLL